MTLKIYNTLGRKIEEFVPLKGKSVGMYVCGPTIYDNGHLGHGRSAVNFDVIRRYLLYRGYNVKYVFNYTDIDDKMINRAKQLNMTVAELAKKMSKIYDEDYAKLGIIKPDINPYATQYIEEQIDIIKKMEANEFTYIIPNDGVYYDVSKFKNYGKLSGVDLEKQKAGARVEVKDAKRNPQDFVLWKFKKEGEPFWPSPWGDGRPGWHLECTAMIWKNLGIPFDIHGGGADLIMPHHEGEIAQGYGAFGNGYAKYWMHNGFINIDNEKMSKSLGNFFTLKEIFGKYEPMVVRFFILLTHYRAPVNFSDALLDQAKSSLERINNFVQNLYEANGKHSDIKKIIDNSKKKFEDSMDNDFEVSGALAAIYDLIRDMNALMMENKLDNKNREEILGLLKEFNSVLNVMTIAKKEIKIDDQVAMLLQQRLEAKNKKDFKKSDLIREELKKKGFIVKDTKDGQKLEKIS